MDAIRAKFSQLNEWEGDVGKYIKVNEIQGLISANGSKMRTTMQTKVKEEQNNFRKYLHLLSKNQSDYINNQLYQIGTKVGDPMKSLAEYVTYVKFIKESQEQFVDLERRKIQLDSMKLLLQRNRDRSESS